MADFDWRAATPVGFVGWLVAKATATAPVATSTPPFMRDTATKLVRSLAQASASVQRTRAQEVINWLDSLTPWEDSGQAREGGLTYDWVPWRVLRLRAVQARDGARSQVDNTSQPGFAEKLDDSLERIKDAVANMDRLAGFAVITGGVVLLGALVYRITRK